MIDERLCVLIDDLEHAREGTMAARSAAEAAERAVQASRDRLRLAAMYEQSLARAIRALVWLGGADPPEADRLLALTHDQREIPF